MIPQFDPTLKAALEEIEEILKKYDLAGMAVVCTPGLAQYLNCITPKFSCIELVSGSIRFKLDLEKDFNGDVEARDKAVNETANMARLMSQTVIEEGEKLKKFSDRFDARLGISHPEIHRATREQFDN